MSLTTHTHTHTHTHTGYPNVLLSLCEGTPVRPRTGSSESPPNSSVVPSVLNIHGGWVQAYRSRSWEQIVSGWDISGRIGSSSGRRTVGFGCFWRQLSIMGPTVRPSRSIYPAYIWSVFQITGWWEEASDQVLILLDISQGDHQNKQAGRLITWPPSSRTYISLLIERQLNNERKTQKKWKRTWGLLFEQWLCYYTRRNPQILT